MDANDVGGFRRRRRGRGAAGGLPANPAASPGSAVFAGAGLGEEKRSLIETALLIALIDESGHGYALIERVQQLVGDQVYVDAGSVYRILRSLEEAGMISSEWEAGVAGPMRRTYAVEPGGRELLRAWAATLTEKGAALLELAGLAEERLM